MAGSEIHRTDAGLEVRLHVQPGASKSEFTGLHADRLKVRIQGKPVDGAANGTLVKFISQTAGVPKSAVQIVRGATSRDKLIRIACDNPSDAASRLRRAAGLAGD